MQHYPDYNIGLIFSVYLGVIIGLLLLIHIAKAIPNTFLFKRAGEKSWKAWVPLVNNYTRTKIVFGEENAWFFLADVFLGGLFYLYVTYNEARAFGRSVPFAILHVLASSCHLPVMSWIMWLNNDEYICPRPFVFDK